MWHENKNLPNWVVRTSDIGAEVEMSLTLGLTLTKEQNLDYLYFLQIMKTILCLWVLKVLICSM